MRMRFGFLLSVLLCSSCAIQVPPQGGDKDISPPVLLSVTPPDGSTGFTAKEIEFVFDENVQLKDLPSKLIVSPPLKTVPYAKVRNNRILVPIEDTLISNTTYCFNFGDAVSDLNEGNSLSELEYVFSTGTFIDSLSLSGKVIRAEDQKPEKSMLVMLYPPNSADSAPYLSSPAYFTRTNEKGLFSVGNIAAGSYRIFALADANQNYKYDDPSERIAFSARTVSASDTAVILRSFQKSPLPAVIKVKADGPGKIDVVMNMQEPKADIRWKELESDLKIVQVNSSPLKDSVSIWYTRLDAESATLLVGFDDRTDTFEVTLKKFDSDQNKGVGFKLVVGTNISSGTLSPNQPLLFRASHPIVRVDRSMILLTCDSVAEAEGLGLEQDSAHMQYRLAVVWKEEMNYRLTVLPGAFTDIFGQTNDTLQESIRIRPATDFGTLKVALSNAGSGMQRVFQLVDEKENVFRSVEVNQDTIVLFDFLSPGTYRLKLTDDANGNGRWDAGDDLSHRLPEEVRYHRDQVPVRANWDVEVKWDLLQR